SYVALAQELETILYTADDKLIRKIGKEYAKNILHVSKI
ncbi:MAG: PIN domain nuclease, partial [Thermoprotei archaeon]